MLSSAIPSRFQIPWANAAVNPTYVRAIPKLSQIGITPGAASLTDGFPPLNFIPVSGGGVPPFGNDMNGILQQVTLWCQWQAAGAPIFYDSAFSTAVGGYPLGAVLTSATIPGLQWRSTVENNTANPDTGGANWVQVARIALLGATTFYVNSSTGNDSTGTGTVSAPWLTLGHALSVLQSLYDFRNNVVTVQLADGTYSTDAFLNGPIPGLSTPNNLIINGNSGSPTSVIYTGTIGIQYGGAMASVQNFKMAGNYGIQSAYGGTALVGGGMNFGAMAGYHIYGNTRGNIIIGGNYTISGGAAAHISMLVGSMCSLNGSLTWTLSGSPVFGSFVIADNGSNVSASNTSSYSGAAGGGGSRATVTLNSVVGGTGANNSYFPGTGNPVLATGGQYA